MGGNKKKRNAKKKGQQASTPTTATTTKTAAAAAVTPEKSPPRQPQQPTASNNDNHSPAHWKQQGNAAFSNQKYADAAACYRSGLTAAAAAACATNTSNDTNSAGDIRVHLHSNLAMVLLKMEDYEAAEKECSIVVQDLEETAIPKVFYRRAVAREGRAKRIQSKEPDEAVKLFTEAALDLNRALQLLGAVTATGGGSGSGKEEAERHSTKKSVLLVAVNVQRSLQSLSNGSKAAPVSVPDRPSAEQQRQDVLRLLVARQLLLQKEHGQAAALPGEAFFLLDWDWWCDWCNHVGVVGVHAPTAGAGSNKKGATLERYLPPGAVLPTVTDEDDEDDEEESGGPPGVIDNRNLFLVPPPHNGTVEPSTRDNFCFQWYQSYLSPPAADDHTHHPLQPNLVRGYHYELLPREVYFALSSWYGEALPSVCRRTADNGTHDCSLPLYPLSSLDMVPPPVTAARTVSYCDACRAPQARLRCKRCMSVYYCDRGCQESHWPFHKHGCQVLQDRNAAAGKNGKTSLERPLLSQGRVGLNNLGNTCFMNSALQCLSHATPLTRLFLSNKYRIDLNTSNALGTGGKLAHAYEIYMKDVWMRLQSGSTSPTALKRAIALFAPRFAGCLQHDAQEFLAYLLDGLHEDLNRIRRAPYVEMPDVTDGQNMAIASARAWEAHQRRNDSLVMETFYGQFKSTCVCPRCNRVSVSFDAFNHVSLEIPQVKNALVALTIVVYRAVSSEALTRKPTRYSVELRRSDTVGDLKLALGELCGVHPNCMALCEVYNNVIVEMLNDNNKTLSDIQASVILGYEVDPFDTDDCYHVVASHRLVEANENPADEEDGVKERVLPLGLPFMTSFSAEFTCRQVWEHVWSHVGRLVEPMPSSETGVDAAKDLLQIHVADGRGTPQRVFPVANEEAPGGESTFDTLIRTSILPKDSDEQLVAYLGAESTSRFVFIHLHWKDDDLAREEGEEDAKKLPVIDEGRFNAVNDDPTWIEAMKKAQATKASNGVTLDQCFDTFTQPERLDENNQWYCSQCKEHVRAMKTMELWRLPNILVVHLKRFEFKHALRRDKLDTLVNFPLDGLDMSAHCASSSSSFVNESVPATYDLFAVTNHFGRMGFGHYTAYARPWDESGISDDWASFDDSSVRSVGSGKGVVSPAAYVLFYRRRVFH